MTRKTRLTLIAALATCTVACAGLFAACSGNGDDNGKKGESAENPITVTAGDYTASVADGNPVYYSIKTNNADDYFTVYTEDANGLITSGSTSGAIVSAVVVSGKYAFSVKTLDGKTGDVAFSVVTGDVADGEVSVKPIFVGEGETTAEIGEGKTVYYRLYIRNDDGEGDYTISTENTNAVIACGAQSGTSITSELSDGMLDFTVRTTHGAAANVVFTIVYNAPMGTERNPYPAVIYDGTDATLYNALTITEKSPSASYSITADEAGFFVITSDNEHIELNDGSGMQPADEFKIVVYLKKDDVFTFSLGVDESYKGPFENDESLKFTVAKDTEHGAGTQADPYRLETGAMCKLKIESEDGYVYFKAVDATGSDVDSVVKSNDMSSEFTSEVHSDGAVAAGDIFGVAFGYGKPSFTVDAAAATDAE